MTTTDLVPAERPMPAIAAGGRVQSIVPQTFDEAYRIAQAVYASGMAPKGMERPEKLLVSIMHGAEVGLPPMQAIQSIAVINGRPSIYGDGALGLVRGSGVCEWIDEHYDGQGDTLTAVCVIKRRGEAQPITRVFSVADAKKAHLLGKDGPWQSYPRRMLQMRARSWALRDGFADVLRGLHIAEEAQDMPPVNQTAGPLPPPTQQLTAPPAPTQQLTAPPAPKFRESTTESEETEATDSESTSEAEVNESTQTGEATPLESATNREQARPSESTMANEQPDKIERTMSSEEAIIDEGSISHEQARTSESTRNDEAKSDESTKRPDLSDINQLKQWAEQKCEALFDRNGTIEELHTMWNDEIAPHMDGMFPFDEAEMIDMLEAYEAHIKAK